MSDTIFRGERLINSGTQSSPLNLGKPHHLPVSPPCKRPERKKKIGPPHPLFRVGETVPGAGRGGGAAAARGESPAGHVGLQGPGLCGASALGASAFPHRAGQEPGPGGSGRGGPRCPPRFPAALPTFGSTGRFSLSRPVLLGAVTACPPLAPRAAPPGSAALPGVPRLSRAGSPRSQ